MSSALHKVIVKGWVEKNGKYLLAKRASTEKHHAGVWSLPGGNIETDIADNIIETTLQREIEEEIGIKVSENMELIYNNSFIKTSDGSHVINLTFICHWESGIEKPLEDTEELKWYSLEELEQLENKPDFLEKEVLNLRRFLVAKQFGSLHK